MIDFEKVFSESYRRIHGGGTSRENEFFDAFYEQRASPTNSSPAQPAVMS